MTWGLIVGMIIGAILRFLKDEGRE